MGGTFTVAGIIDSCIFSATEIFKKFELGKINWDQTNLAKLWKKPTSDNSLDAPVLYPAYSKQNVFLLPFQPYFGVLQWTREINQTSEF